jgi:phosphopantothenoylcysteine decarboxylase / phosphopantothenate---cysteine ligase
LKNKIIILGITGGIAAYKSISLARRLTESGATVKTVMTEAATEFVGPVSFSAITGQPVAVSMFDGQSEALLHITAANEADLILVAPATADFIAKTAAGLAPDLLSSIILAAGCPIIIAPAMNTGMLQNPATQENLRIVRERAILLVGPIEGKLAEGYGYGRMADEEDIIAAVSACLMKKQTLKGKRILVTAGGTQEAIDAVRYLGNRSSGKMGYAIAEAAAVRGAKVTLVSAPTELTKPVGIEFIAATSAEDMRRIVMKRYDKTDIVIMAAAVADLRAANKASEKIKKQDLGELRLEPTDDILKELGAKKQKQFLVGFSAETSELISNAQRKMEEKNLDVIVANDISRPDIGLGSDFNQVTILTKEGRVHDTKRLLKSELAALLLDDFIAT